MASKEILFSVVLRPNAGQGLPHYWGLQIKHKGAPWSVWLLWTSDQLVAETSTWQHTQHSQETDIHAPGGIQTMIPGSQRPQNHDLDRAATGIGCKDKWVFKLWTSFHKGGHVSTYKPCQELRVFFQREHNTGMNTLRLLQTLFLTSWLKKNLTGKRI